MARLVCAVFALLVLASMPARADGPTQMYYAPTGAPPFQPWAGATSPSYTTPVAGAQYGLTLAAATTLTVPATAKMANVTVEGQSIRCTTDGATTPTSTVGVLYQVGTLIQAFGTAMSNLKCIQTAASATVDVEYFR